MCLHIAHTSAKLTISNWEEQKEYRRESEENKAY